LTALLLMLLVGAGGAAAVVASATSPESSRRETQTAAGRHADARVSRGTELALGPRALALQALHRENEVIDRVLAYTPFVRAGVPRQRVVALTFDDGPSPYTPGIVRELVRMHAPATFFIVGQQLRYFAAGLRDEVRNGFVIGDHTENHPPLNLMGAAAQYAQIDQAASRIRGLGAPFPRLFRPPYGIYDANTFSILRRLRMLMVMWSVDPRDWLRPGTRTIVRRVLAGVRPGAIVEMHDGGGDRGQTAAALPAIIVGLRRRHYDLVTVPQLLAADPPPRHQLLSRVTE
jgi:peptidoglycan-N-acetylglucosamine deacetylase